MIRFLERNGYDVSYFGGVDADRRGAEIREHKVFMSSGHDEYWSGKQRANVESRARRRREPRVLLRQRGVLEDPLGAEHRRSATQYRTLVCYKETAANAKIDPSPEWTGTWRDPRFSPPADGGRPENALTGTLFRVNATRNDTIQVPAADGKMRLWRNTSVASLPASGVATLTTGTLGYEWDEAPDIPSRPPGLFNMSTTTRRHHRREVPARQRPHLRERHRDAPPHDVPGAEWRARVRRRDRAVGLGPRHREPARRQRPRRPDAAGDGEPPRGPGRAADHADGRRGRGDGVERPHGAHEHDQRAGRRCCADPRHTGRDLGDRDGRRRRTGGRRRRLDRQRRHVAPGGRSGAVDLRLDAERARAPRRSWRERWTTAPTSRRLPPRRR